MINEYIRYKIDPNRSDAFVNAYKAAGESLKASKHCEGYDLSQCVEAPDQFILNIHWDSQEGHLRGFRSSPEFKTFFQAIQPYVSDIQEMRHYRRTPVQWSNDQPA